MFAIVAFVVAFAAVAFAMVSPDMCLDLLVWVFHPNNSWYSLDHALHMINVAIVTAMWTMIPTLILVDRVLSVRTYLGKLFVIATWVTSLFVIEEICNIELLSPELFIAVLVVAAMYLLAFLRFPLMIKIVFLLSRRIMGLILRTFSFVTRLIVNSIRLIIAPLVLQMLVKDFLQVMPTNLPIFGLIVVVGSSSAILLYEILQLALRGFDVLTDAIASNIVHLPPADTSESSDYIARLPLVLHVSWAQDVVSGHIVSMKEAGRRTAFRKLCSMVDGNYEKQWRARRALKGLVPLMKRFRRNHPLRLRSWSDFELMFRECKLYEQGIDMIFLEMKLRAEFLPTPSLTIVQRTWEDAVFDDADIVIQEAAVEPIGARAQEEADAMPRIEEEDRLVEAAVEVLAAEEPVAFDQPDAMEERELIEEAAVEPIGARAQEEADAMPRIEEEDRLVEAAVEVLAAEEPVAFDQPDAMEEREQEEDVPAPSVKRRRRRSEVAKLSSQLGSYWVTPSRPRRGARVRRQPERYKP